MTAAVTLQIRIKNVRYPKIEQDQEKRNNGESRLFYICDATLNDNTTIPIKGMLPARPIIGEKLDVTGRFAVYQGLREFRFDFAQPVIAVNKRELLTYAVELTNGFGDYLEEEIWTKYGETWEDDITAGEIKGLTESKVNALKETIEKLRLNAERTKVISWLISHGLSVKMAEKAFELFGRETQITLEKDCYQLIRVDGVGFTMVDNSIRHFFHVEDTAEIRINAAILYGMQTLSERGDTLIEWNTLQGEVFNMLKVISCDRIAKAVTDLFAKGALVGFSAIGKIALAKHYKAETIIYHFIKEDEADADNKDVASMFIPVII